VGNDDDLRFAHELADAADEITLSRFRSLDLRVEQKPDLTPVSDADRAAEVAVRELVAGRGAGEDVVGEEFGGAAGGGAGGGARWIVDPIDGTRNYVRGVPVWATLLALERNGVVEVAVVSAPALGRRWSAVRGGGASAGGGTRLHVSGVSRLEDAVTSTTSAAAMPRGWAAVTARAWTDRGFGDFWQYCLLAEGAVDVATDAVLELWDYAAVRLLVEEAGGRCTTFAGTPPTARESFLATNGLLHDEVVSLLGADDRGQTP
jgi:histidinol-phosphatase